MMVNKSKNKLKNTNLHKQRPYQVRNADKTRQKIVREEKQKGHQAIIKYGRINPADVRRQ